MLFPSVCLLAKYLLNHWADFNETFTGDSHGGLLQLVYLWGSVYFKMAAAANWPLETQRRLKSEGFTDLKLKAGVVVAEGHPNPSVSVR